MPAKHPRLIISRAPASPSKYAWSVELPDGRAIFRAAEPFPTLDACLSSADITGAVFLKTAEREWSKSHPRKPANQAYGQTMGKG